MPRPKTIHTDPEPVLLSLLTEEVRRLAQLASDRLEIWEDRRDRLQQEWDAEPVVIVQGRPPRHWLRDRCKTFEAALEHRKLVEPPPSPTLADIETWQDYDLPTLTGQRYLTPSERIKWQGQLRAMEADGLLELQGQRATRVRLTETGRQRARDLLAVKP